MSTTNCGPASSICRTATGPKARPRRKGLVQPRSRGQWSSCESLSSPGLLAAGGSSNERHHASSSLRILPFLIGIASAVKQEVADIRVGGSLTICKRAAFCRGGNPTLKRQKIKSRQQCVELKSIFKRR